MLRNLKRTLLGLGLAGLPLAAAAQERTAKPDAKGQVNWVESRFHRVHLKNGNFIDGDLISKDNRLIVLKLKAGEFGIRADMINRLEYMKVRSLHEAPPIVAFKKEEAPDGPPVVLDSAPRPDAPAAPVLPGAESSRGLAQTLSNESPERRRTKLRELWESKGDQAPEFIAGLLEQVKNEVRYDIVALLIEKEAVNALPVIFKLLRSPNAGVRDHALKAVYGLGTETHLPQVEFCLADSDPIVRSQAIMVFQKLGTAEHFEVVAGKLRDADPSVRGAALSALTSLAKRLSLKAELSQLLRREVEDAPSVETAAAIVATLGKIGDKELGPELAKYAVHDEPMVRAEAIAGLVATDPTLAGPLIMERFEAETEYAPRIQLAEGSRRMRLKPAIPVLVEWLLFEDANLRSAASAALRTISGQNFGSDHEKWSEWWELAKPKK